MLEWIYTDPKTIEGHRQMLLFGPYVDSFVAARRARRYATQTLRHDISHVHRFAVFLMDRGKGDLDQIELEDVDGYVDLVVSNAGGDRRPGRSARGSIRAFIGYLVIAKVLACSPLEPTTWGPLDRWSDLLSDYLCFLRKHRGLSQSTIRSRALWARALFDHLSQELQAAPLSSITIGMIDAFVLERTGSVSRAYQHQIVQTVRSVLRYLRHAGHLVFDLASLVAAPRRYVGAHLPAQLEADQVARILDATDRRRAIGMRDYAMLTVLAVYGLRACEVTSLRLGDLDWKADKIQVLQGKSRRRLLLPLTPQVGEAIVAYLHEGRPETDHRELFVRHQAPYSPIKSAAVYRIVSQAMARAGVDVGRRGPHLFRHGRATAWIRGGWSLKAVGDLLGHRCEDTTRVYANLAVEDLRQVALDAPEVA